MGIFARWGLVLVLCSSWWAPVRAWWPVEHAIIATIAESFLTASSRRLVAQLLAVPVMHPGSAALAAATDDLMRASLWMDLLEETYSDDSVSWPSQHLLPSTVDGGAACQPVVALRAMTKAMRQMPANIRSALDAALRTLRDSEAGVSHRAVALRTVLHLVGDLHQPLHLVEQAAFGEATGASTRVRLDGVNAEQYTAQGKLTSLALPTLHDAWDAGGGVVAQWPDLAWQERTLHLSGVLPSVLEPLVDQVQRVARDDVWVDVGTPERWAVESWVLGCEWFRSGLMRVERTGSGVYARFPQYTPAISYIQEASARQLVRAGKRLAALLNALTDPYAHPTLTKYLSDLDD